MYGKNYYNLAFELQQKILKEVDIPVKYVGLGEGMDDLQVFDVEKYIYGLFKDMVGESSEE